MKYILGVVAQLHQQWSPSWILQEVEIKLKPWEMVIFGVCIKK